MSLNCFTQPRASPTDYTLRHWTMTTFQPESWRNAEVAITQILRQAKWLDSTNSTKIIEFRFPISSRLTNTLMTVINKNDWPPDCLAGDPHHSGGWHLRSQQLKVLAVKRTRHRSLQLSLESIYVPQIWPNYLAGACLGNVRLQWGLHQLWARPDLS